MNKTNSLKTLLTNGRRVAQLLWRTDRKMFILSVVFVLLASVMPVVFSYNYKLLLDSIVSAQNTTATLSIALFSIFIFRYVMKIFDEIRMVLQNDYFDRIFRLKFENLLTLEVLRKLALLDIPHYENAETQNLILKGKQAYPWRLTNFMSFAMYTLVALGMLVSSFVALLTFAWWPPLVAVAVMVPIFYYKNLFIKLEWIRYNQNINESKEVLYMRGLLESKSDVQELRIAQGVPAILERIKRLQDKLFGIIQAPMRSFLPKYILAVVFQTIVFGLLVYYKLSPTVAGLMTLGAFTFYIQMLDRADGSIGNLINYFSRLNEQNLYVGYFFEVIDLPPVIKEKSPGVIMESTLPPRIQFRDVSFGYDNERAVIRKISFSINPGEHVAIVGANGAGKTTLAKLLLRFYDPVSGEILIDGHDLKDIRLASWYDRVGILFQDFVKFSLTVRDNILLGDSSKIDEERMQKAADRSGASEFIEKFPNKYDQRLGKRFEDSRELSHGQWQKLALARAFYESAPLLILDEPTSAIDAEAEAAIFDNLFNLYKEKSLLIISHRFSTVRHAHKIIVLKDGGIAEEGSHEKLMALGGIYASMFNKQAKGYID